MVENEDRLKGTVNTLISEIDDLKSSCDSDVLKNSLQKLRSTHEQFRKVSLELSGWYDRNGSNASVTEVDDDRRNLYGEYKLAFNKINNRIKNLGSTPASSMLDPSEYRSEIGSNRFSQSDSVNSWLADAQNQPVIFNENVVTESNQNDTSGAVQQLVEIDMMPSSNVISSALNKVVGTNYVTCNNVVSSALNNVVGTNYVTCNKVVSSSLNNEFGILNVNETRASSIAQGLPFRSNISNDTITQFHEAGPNLNRLQLGPQLGVNYVNEEHNLINSNEAPYRSRNFLPEPVHEHRAHTFSRPVNGVISNHDHRARTSTVRWIEPPLDRSNIATNTHSSSVYPLPIASFDHSNPPVHNYE